MSIAILIEVTQDDIDRGHPRRRDCCPIALAIDRVVDPSSLSITHKSARFMGSATYRDGVYDLPMAAERFQLRQDTGWSVEPFQFRLDVGVLGKPPREPARSREPARWRRSAPTPWQ